MTANTESPKKYIGRELIVILEDIKTANAEKRRELYIELLAYLKKHETNNDLFAQHFQLIWPFLMQDIQLDTENELRCSALRIVGMIVFLEKSVKELSEEQLKQISLCLIYIIKNLKEKSSVNLAVWCISSQSFPVPFLAKDDTFKEFIIVILHAITQYPTSNSIQNEAMNGLLHLANQNPKLFVQHADLWLKLVIFANFNEIQTVRENAEHLLTQLLPSIADQYNEVIHPIMQDFFTQDIKTFALQLNGSQLDERAVLKIWGNCCVIFGKCLIRSEFMNALLKIIEKFFNSTKVEVKKFAILAWSRLIYTFGLSEMNERKIALLIKPIHNILKKETDPGLRLTCLKVFKALLYALGPKLLQKNIFEGLLFGTIKYLIYDTSVANQNYLEHFINCLFVFLQPSPPTPKKFLLKRILIKENLSWEEILNIDEKWVCQNIDIFISFFNFVMVDLKKIKMTSDFCLPSPISPLKLLMPVFMTKLWDGIVQSISCLYKKEPNLVQEPTEKLLNYMVQAFGIKGGIYYMTQDNRAICTPTAHFCFYLCKQFLSDMPSKMLFTPSFKTSELKGKEGQLPGLMDPVAMICYSFFSLYELDFPNADDSVANLLRFAAKQHFYFEFLNSFEQALLVSDIMEMQQSYFDPIYLIILKLSIGIVNSWPQGDANHPLGPGDNPESLQKVYRVLLFLINFIFKQCPEYDLKKDTLEIWEDLFHALYNVVILVKYKNPQEQTNPLAKEFQSILSVYANECSDTHFLNMTNFTDFIIRTINIPSPLLEKIPAKEREQEGFYMGGWLGVVCQMLSLAYKRLPVFITDNSNNAEKCDLYRAVKYMISNVVEISKSTMNHNLVYIWPYIDKGFHDWILDPSQSLARTSPPFLKKFFIQQFEQGWKQLMLQQMEFPVAYCDSFLLQKAAPIFYLGFSLDCLFSYTLKAWEKTFGKTHDKLEYPFPLKGKLKEVKKRNNIHLPNWRNVDQKKTDSDEKKKKKSPERSLKENSVISTPTALSDYLKVINQNSNSPNKKVLEKENSIQYTEVEITPSQKVQKLTQHQKEMMKEKRVQGMMNTPLDSLPAPVDLSNSQSFIENQPQNIKEKNDLNSGKRKVSFASPLKETEKKIKLESGNSPSTVIEIDTAPDNTSATTTFTNTISNILSPVIIDSEMNTPTLLPHSVEDLLKEEKLEWFLKEFMNREEDLKKMSVSGLFGIHKLFQECGLKILSVLEKKTHGN